jgi:hypothetical protein
MAGSFGYEAEHYEVSKKIGEERLFPAVNALNSSTTVAVAGVSCRQQIDHFTGRNARHIAEVLASRIDRSRPWTPPATPEPVPVVEPTPEAEAREDQVGIEAP